MTATRPTRAVLTPPTEQPPIPPRPAPVQVRARRSPRLIVIGILCACLGSLVMAWVWSSTQESQAVVVMSADVYRGEQITATDLAVTTLGRANGVQVIPADQSEQLVGQFAKVDLPAGSLPGPTAVGEQLIAAGSVQLGLRLSAGRLPNQPLPPGSQVSLIGVPSGQDATTAGAQSYAATVVSAPQANSDGSWLLDVQVAEAAAAPIAILAAGDQIVLVRKADR